MFRLKSHRVLFQRFGKAETETVFSTVMTGYCREKTLTPKDREKKDEQ